MSGIAIIIPGADFSGKNLGKVTFLENIDVTGISIIANNSYTGIMASLTAAYAPINTLQKGCTWSITSGNEFATIDANSGVLTILSGANASAVTVKATSTYNSSITATKNITLTYQETVAELNGISIAGAATVNGQTSKYTIVYDPINSSYKGVTWSIISGGEYATINAATGILTVLSGASVAAVRIKAISTHDTSLSATKDITVSYSEPIFDLTGKVAYVPFRDFTANMTIYAEFNNASLTDTDGKICLITGLRPKVGYLQDSWVDCCVISTYLSLGNQRTFALQQTPSYSTSEANGTAARVMFHIVTISKILMNKSKFIFDGIDVDGNTISSEREQTPQMLDRTIKANSGYLYFNATGGTARAHDPHEYTTNAALKAAVTLGDIVPLMSFGIKKLICYKSTSYTTYEDVIANRASADIDLQFDENGNPYNAGTSGTLIYSE